MSPTLKMPTAKTPKPRKNLSFLLPLILVLGIIAFIYWLYSGRVVSENGELSAGFIPITIPVSSTVNSVLVEPNARVQAGQLLAKLDVGDYLQQLVAAKDLVRGSINNLDNTAARVEEVQKATEDMVKRIALARHEESIRKQLVEQSSIEHAKALLNMRNIDTQGGSAAQKEAARKQEFSAQQKLQSAKGAFELASKSRTAIENELHKIRNYKAALDQDINITNIDPSLVYAPINGYITKTVPLSGQTFNMGDTLFQIIPEDNVKLYAIAKLPKEYASKIPNNVVVFVRPNNGFAIYEGSVESISVDTNTTHVSLNLKNIDNAHANTHDDTRTIFWIHPLANNFIVKYLLMALSYLPF